MEKADTDSVYHGRYLKLFDEQTRKPTHPLPQTKTVLTHKTKQTLSHERTELGGEISISEQFQRMKAQHERIMMIMSGQSQSQNGPDLPKFRYTEQQSQNKIPTTETVDRFNPEKYPQSASPSFVAVGGFPGHRRSQSQLNGFNYDSEKLHYQSKLTEMNNKLTSKELIDLANPAHLYQPMALENKQIGVVTHMPVGNGSIPKVIDSMKMLNEVMTPPRQQYLPYRKTSEAKPTAPFRIFQQTFPNHLSVLSRPISQRSKAPNTNFAHTQQIPTSYTLLERQQPGLPFSPRSQNFRSSLPNVPQSKVNLPGQLNMYPPLRPSSFSREHLKIPQPQVEPLSLANPVIRQTLNRESQKLLPRRGSGNGITLTIKKK